MQKKKEMLGFFESVLRWSTARVAWRWVGVFMEPQGALIYQNESDYDFQKHIMERLTDRLQSGDQQPDLLFNLA